MNQSMDVVSLVAGVAFVALGLWLAGDVVGSRPSLPLLVPVVGVAAVVFALAAARGARY